MIVQSVERWTIIREARVRLPAVAVGVVVLSKATPKCELTKWTTPYLPFIYGKTSWPYLQRYVTQRGRPRTKRIKYSQGTFCFLILVIIIWLPIFFFAISGYIYPSNPPVSMSVQISINDYEVFCFFVSFVHP